jgi:hypothetical protein
VLENIEHLDAPVLQRLLRRTTLLSIAVGTVFVFCALLLDAPLAAVGIVVGLGLAIVNLRFLDAGVAKVQGTGEGSSKVLRRMLRTKTAWRLAAITVIAIGALLLSTPLGIGIVIGLVIFQILFVIAVARIIFVQGGAL